MPGPYRSVSRPYVKRFRSVYRQHLFDKLHELDRALAEFQRMLGHGEVIAEALGMAGPGARPAHRMAPPAAPGRRR
jgi:hypothetical protein